SHVIGWADWANGSWNGIRKMEASTKRRRILALWLPRLSTDRLTRLIASHNSKPSETPLVIAGRANNALYVYALNVAASRQGIYRGQPLANARAMIQNLRIVPADEKADAELLEGIADWCDRFTPLVALDLPQGLLLDITGVAHLFGGEEAMLALVRAKITAQGFAVQGTIAGTCLAARALARHAKNTIAPPGENARLLAPLPVAALDCGEDIMRAFRRAGLKTIGQEAFAGCEYLTNACFAGDEPVDGGSIFYYDFSLPTILYVSSTTGWGATYDGIATTPCAECGNGAPTLTVTRSGTNVLLTWSSDYIGFTLQSTTNLNPAGIWNNVSPAPVIINGLNTVTNSISGKQNFYRLMSP
ncbi:MAG: DNA polymerase Y family protein, partial [Verrucomicrobiota bacterium]